MDLKCYRKKYVMRTNGTLLLMNPEPALQYINTMTGQLVDAKNQEEERKVKLEILRDFQQIYAYDLVHTDRPEPFGHFESQKDKERFIKQKTLNEDFALYLTNIFTNFHEQRFLKDRKVPLLRCPRMVIDYNELYDRAIDEYAGTLLGAVYGGIKEDGRLVYEDATTENARDETEQSLVWKEVEWRGVVRRVQVPADARIVRPKKSEHAIGTSFILPSLIEHFLGVYLQNRLLFSGLKQLRPLLQGNEIVMDDEERNIIQVFTGQKRDQIMFHGTQEYIMGKVYGVLVRAGVLENMEDNELILTGQSGRKRRMLGNMLHTSYAKSQIRPEYMELLTNMFHKMNIRNSIMHGSSETFDYLAIGVASVMMQVLWDIANEDLFVSARGL